MQSLFFLITTMFQRGINKKITFNKHFARKYILLADTSAHLEGSEKNLDLKDLFLADYSITSIYSSAL